MSNSMQTAGDLLEWQTRQHSERTFSATLQNQPFSVEHLRSLVYAETEHWAATVSNLKEGQAFLTAFDGIRHALTALKYEDRAMKDVARGIVGEQAREWDEAATFYCRALSDLYSAQHGWHQAISELADDSPFDPYYPTKVEREKHDMEEPPRASYAEMRRLAPQLSRIYRNIDRISCIGQELAQRQMTCLTQYMQEAQEV